MVAAAARMFGRDLMPRVDCRRCQSCPDPRDRAQIRLDNGCDAPASRSVWSTSCACGEDPSCRECDGTGRREFFRCPGALIDGRLDVAEACTAWLHFDARHVAPCSGGLHDQAAVFVDVCSILDQERSKWDERREEKREREAERNRRR